MNASRRLCGAAPRPSRPAASKLLGVERIALAARKQPLNQPAAGSVTEDVGQRFSELVAIEWLQVDAPRALEPLELAEQRPHRVAAMQLVGPEAEQLHHPLLPEAAGEERDKRPRRAIRPVHVLEHQRDRLVLAEAIEQFEQRLEQAQLL